MKYEIVNLEEKTVAGLTARTNNLAPDSQMIIGGLWQRFYGEGIYESLKGKVNDKALGIYTEYAGDHTCDYTVMIACETDKMCIQPENIAVKKIPGGKYAKFVMKGNMHKIVADFWQQLWQMDLPRAFTSDFEEYQNADMEQAEVHFYISLL
ncbi:GyrI-like domain-containing protein [Blautia schinkii]|nr:GyrI-like domain-containing protein [Blautia schinkii]